MSAIEMFRAPARTGLFTRLGAALGGWLDARDTRNQLNRLTDRELSDIGLSRGDIERVARGV